MISHRKTEKEKCSVAPEFKDQYKMKKETLGGIFIPENRRKMNF